MKNKIFKICAITICAYIIVAFAFYFIAGEGFRKSTNTTKMISPKAATGELYKGQTLSQEFTIESDTLDSLTVMGGTYTRSNLDTLVFSIKDDTGTILAQAELKTAELPDNALWLIVFTRPVEGVSGKILTLCVTSENGTPGNAVALYYGDSVNTGKFEVILGTQYPVRLNDVPFEGVLCLSLTGTNYYTLAQYYWYVVSSIGLFLLVYFLWMIYCGKKGKNNLGIRTVDAFSKYGFLLKQLVQRDFKTKYKRSALGMLWSFLNPLLTMLVLYIVFATLFKSSITNFPVYLLTGIVCWSFFSEATSMCLTSITGNTALITKVYVPKYMYPFSRSVSSLVNFGLSLIPLFIVLLITQTKFTLSFLLLPYPILCLFVLSLGMGLMLASSMVYFRDTQFLWNVVSMLWMYLTPIFYDPSIIPEKLMVFYKINPLYHITRVFRVLLINGVSPEPKAYLLCFVASFLPFLIGVLIFRKSQDRFVLFL